MSKLNFPKILAFSLGVLAMIFSLNYLILAWTEPGTLPPNPNVPAPINVGTSTQIKAGPLGVNGLLTAYSGMNANNNKITEVKLPTDNLDAANKEYVDTVAALTGASYTECYILSKQANESCAAGYIAVAQSSGNGCAWSCAGPGCKQGGLINIGSGVLFTSNFIQSMPTGEGGGVQRCTVNYVNNTASCSQGPPMQMFQGGCTESLTVGGVNFQQTCCWCPRDTACSNYDSTVALCCK